MDASQRYTPVCRRYQAYNTGVSDSPKCRCLFAQPLPLFVVGGYLLYKYISKNYLHTMKI
jgi:hypothetical protein